MAFAASRNFSVCMPAHLRLGRTVASASLVLALLSQPNPGAAQAIQAASPLEPIATTEVAATPTVATASPRFLLKAGLQLTHLFYLPDHQSWQLVFPASLGLEYRLNSRFSLLARAEADIAAGRAPRGRRGAQ
ncbi:hypothetical protein, partial [Hymenobacter agri]